MEPFYYGHLGDLVKCLVYSGTPLLRTPWGSGEVSCIERCPHFRRRKHVWDIAKCAYYRGVLISGVSFMRGSTVCSLSCMFDITGGEVRTVGLVAVYKLLGIRLLF